MRNLAVYWNFDKKYPGPQARRSPRSRYPREPAWFVVCSGICGNILLTKCVLRNTRCGGIHTSIRPCLRSVGTRAQNMHQRSEFLAPKGWTVLRASCKTNDRPKYKGDISMPCPCSHRVKMSLPASVLQKGLEPTFLSFLNIEAAVSSIPPCPTPTVLSPSWKHSILRRFRCTTVPSTILGPPLFTFFTCASANSNNLCIDSVWKIRHCYQCHDLHLPGVPVFTSLFYALVSYGSSIICIGMVVGAMASLHLTYIDLATRRRSPRLQRTQWSEYSMTLFFLLSSVTPFTNTQADALYQPLPVKDSSVGLQVA
ncbi:hypothetical protein PAXRUDRAFT_822514 [Paxillus rubicundulus Ve08.2h10]|uniref:Uncharacterized protein n=1 Tax=Paxillus rubicundulus Ve08.2h10 TaxID=930991 RepID=A0A0D0E534_9AGAM|nr:hypothetical protein PAXRUDRAFT_822514 [Paxillus rubicundulus Ve08.2h10]